MSKILIHDLVEDAAQDFYDSLSDLEVDDGDTPLRGKQFYQLLEIEDLIDISMWAGRNSSPFLFIFTFYFFMI